MKNTVVGGRVAVGRVALGAKGLIFKQISSDTEQSGLWWNLVQTSRSKYLYSGLRKAPKLSSPKPVFPPAKEAHVSLREFVGIPGWVTAAIPSQRKYQVCEETTLWRQDFISSNPLLAEVFPLG